MQEAETYGFNIDRGGTFTDFYVQDIKAGQVVKQTVFKVPSESALGQGPIVGIRKYLSGKGVMEKDTKIPTKFIQFLNLGTTIATNALLQHKGTKNAMILTDGFGDLLNIRHQARPNIFDLKCWKQPPLADLSLQFAERTYLQDIEDETLIQTIDGQGRAFYVQKPTETALQKVAKELSEQGISSVGVSFCNGYLSSENERIVGEYLSKSGVANIELGSNYHQQGYLLRSQTANLDAYLNPIMKQYFSRLKTEFDQPEQLLLRIMKSNGGFDRAQNAMASQLLLSGPAGGLIGCKSIIPLFEQASHQTINNLICLDMGGTSTDISRIEDQTFTTRYSFDVEGIEICTPHLQIDTIAAGGGSKLTFEHGLFAVGPESVGSNPGPVCYGIGEDLALTDANMILNRLDPSYFPKIFGPDKNEPPNREKSLAAFERLATKINQGGANKTIYQIAEGYIDIANELMAKSTRKLLAMGIPDALVIFGSAGGQHCCDLGHKLGVNRIFIHKFSGILSAYGLSKAVELKENKIYLGNITNRSKFNYNEFIKKVDQLKSKDKGEYTHVEYEVGIGYKGTGHTIKVPLAPDMLEVFEKMHKKQSGFSLPSSLFRIEFITQNFMKYPEQFQQINQDFQSQDPKKFVVKRNEVFLDGKFDEIAYYDTEEMKNCTIDGPALLLSSTSSVLVKKGWKAHVSVKLIYIAREEPGKVAHEEKAYEEIKPDPIKLTLYSTRLMAIAEQMGKILEKISISTNIKERLDFSCGIFDWQGNLLANAPHLPVHLGSMGTAVRQQINRGIEIGDVILTNHPNAGGSHLPDLTVVSCIELSGVRMYLASRGHHADIGGITPGSMPAFSKHISQEGVATEKFRLMDKGVFLQDQVRKLFKQSRQVNENVSDLLAQIAANQMGAMLLGKLIEEYGLPEFKRYVGFICDNAAEAVRNMLVRFSIKNGFKEVESVSNTEYMDDGTPLRLKLTIDRVKKEAIFDFTGTGPQILGNTNTPRSITKSAILYCLRSLVGEDIPLNAGCLTPITIIIPDNSILSPSITAAVVGGNVETSQRLVDLILKPFNYVAASQGTMNNFLFGSDNLSYYETICGGTGAGDGFNGTTTQCHMTNTRITDVQSLEKSYPIVIKQFRQRKDSGGKGKFTGGNGVLREFMFLKDLTISVLTERRVFPAYGLQEGQNGECGRNIYITREGVEKSLGAKSTFGLKRLESVRIETPGGGGYGRID